MPKRSKKVVDQFDWLMENSGPVIRYRTATELMAGAKDIDREKLREEFLASHQVKTWIGRIGKPSDNGTVGWYGGGPDTFETITGKLWDMGLRAGIPALDEKLAPYRSWISEHTRVYGETADELYMLWAQQQCVVGLVRLGYADGSLKVVLKRWLEVFYQTASLGHYEPCFAAGFYRDVPVPFRGKPVFKPGKYSAMPGVDHLYALACLPPDLATKSIKSRVDVIMRYVLDPRFTQRCEAVLRPEPHKALAAGWGVDLPGLKGFKLDDSQAQCLVQRLDLMARFPRARATEWFSAAMKHLETFKTPDKTWIFPRTYLRDGAPGGAWSSGFWMGLEENRKTPKALEIESTFRMLKLKNLIE